MQSNILAFPPPHVTRPALSQGMWTTWKFRLSGFAFPTVIALFTFALGCVVFPKDTLAVPVELQILGVDSSGHQLIYDPHLNIIWYDFSFTVGGWQPAIDLASNLTVDFQGTAINGWTLPTALNGDGSGPCFGFNCTESPMGHLYYTELGNVAGGPPLNHSPFMNLLPPWYDNPTTGIPPLAAFWLSTPVGDPHGLFAFDFNFKNGSQIANLKGEADVPYAVVVHEGRLATVPEPSTIILLSIGVVGFLVFSKRKKLSIV